MATVYLWGRSEANQGSSADLPVGLVLSEWQEPELFF